MEQQSINIFEKVVADFRSLTAKVEKDNQNITKSLKETNLVLEACKKEYQKFYFVQGNLKKKKKRRAAEQIA